MTARKRKTNRVDRYRRALRESDLPPSARFVAYILSEVMDFSTLRNSRLGNQKIAARTGYNVDTVKRALRTLEAEGWIAMQHPSRGRGNAITWAGQIPKPDDSPTVAEVKDILQDLWDHPGSRHWLELWFDKAATPSGIRDLRLINPRKVVNHWIDLRADNQDREQIDLPSEDDMTLKVYFATCHWGPWWRTDSPWFRRRFG